MNRRRVGPPPNPTRVRYLLAAVIVTFVIGGLVAAIRPGFDAHADGESASSSAGESPRPSGPPLAEDRSEPILDLKKMVVEAGVLKAPMSDGGTAELTLIPAMQAKADEVLSHYPIPFAAAAVVSVSDGRVLVLSGQSKAAPELGPADLALRPWAPAASIFKLVSAAAMLDQRKRGFGIDTQVCYHGGLRGIYNEHLVDNKRLDRSCDGVALGVSKSQNALMAKMATRYLDRPTLKRMIVSFGFGARIPLFGAEFFPSDAFVPIEQLEFARMAAGFWHSSLSALHGALIAAAIANDGRMPMPQMVARWSDEAGDPQEIPTAPRGRRVVKPAIARAVAKMMVMTTKTGTGRSHFHDRRGRPYLAIDVAGKTGSLDYRGEAGDPAPPAAWSAGEYLGYNWFVGFAPASEPELAFGVILGNPGKWHIKAPYVARRLIETFIELKKQVAPVVSATPGTTE